LDVDGDQSVVTGQGVHQVAVGHDADYGTRVDDRGRAVPRGVQRCQHDRYLVIRRGSQNVDRHHVGDGHPDLPLGTLEHGDARVRGEPVHQQIGLADRARQLPVSVDHGQAGEAPLVEDGRGLFGRGLGRDHHRRTGHHLAYPHDRSFLRL